MPRASRSPGVLEAHGFGKNCIKKKTAPRRKLLKENQF